MKLSLNRVIISCLIPLRTSLPIVALAAFCTGTCLGPQMALAQQYASKQRASAALGHYARARAMLVEALAEFEEGRKNARPDLLIDPEEWRLSIISRTEELNRLLDPRPRVTRDGVRFQANKALIRREKDRTPPVADGAKDGNTYGEGQRKQELQKSRARLEQSATETVATTAKKAPASATAKAAGKEKAEEQLVFDEEEKPTASADKVEESGKGQEVIQEATKQTTKQTTPQPTEEETLVEEEEEVGTSAVVIPSTKKAEPSKATAAEESAEKQLFEDEEDELGAGVDSQGSAEESVKDTAKDKGVAKKAEPAKATIEQTKAEPSEEQVSKAIEEAITERLKSNDAETSLEEEVLEDER